MSNFSIALMAASALIVSVPASARTLTVEKDGSGDYTVIQDAIDAAEPGDTVQIGPGIFEEYAFAWNNGQWDVYACALVTVSDLTLQGSGTSETIIGLPTLEDHPDLDVKGIGMIEEGRLGIQGISVRGVDTGIYFYSSDLEISTCDVTGCDGGVLSWGWGGNRIEDVFFHDNVGSDLHLTDNSENVVVVGCTFESSNGGVYLASVSDASVSDCSFETIPIGVRAVDGTSATIESCTFANSVGVYCHSSTVRILSNYFGSSRVAVEFLGQGSYVATGNVFEGCAERTIRIDSGWDIQVNGNHILPGAGVSVDASVWRNLCPEVCHIDFTGNYWGTNDPAEIEDRIIDYHDFNPIEGFHWAVIDFDPFEEDEVRTERRSWGSLKSLFH